MLDWKFMGLEASVGVPCRPDGSRPEIYLKREDLNHTGAHKINNSLGQALMCLRMGKKKIIAETGAGQHGVATVSSSTIHIKKRKGKVWWMGSIMCCHLWQL